MGQTVRELQVSVIRVTADDRETKENMGETVGDRKVTWHRQ